MRDRDNNETGQSHKAQLKPETPRLEEVISPLTTEDYGTLQLLAQFKSLAQLPGVAVTHTTKVRACGRLVVEFQAVRLGSLSPELDVQSLGGEV